uniref:lamin tail domain-containing protein n=1 Tax=Candidatus Oscillochloris fontis TaxID=2496868 RepID=UPI0013754639
VVEEPAAPVVVEEPAAPVVVEEPAAPVVVEEPAAPVVVEEPVAPVSGVTITHIEYDPPGRDLDGEYVLIWNNSETPVKMNGWTLSDNDGKHTFTFRNYTLAPNAEIKVWSKRGKTGGGNFYWSNRTAIWNNDGDTGTLKDADGNVISTYSYSGKKKN